MEKIFIFGHKKPDTDSVTSAIALSYLKNKLGLNCEPRVLGNINDETKYVLKQFKVKEPKFLNDVKLQIKDIDYTKNCFLHINDSIFDGYNYMADKTISTLPIVDNNNKFIGAISLKDITKKLLSKNLKDLTTSYNNISFALKAEEVLKFDEEIKGNIISAAYSSTSFRNNVNIDRNSIVIVGDRHSIIEYAIENKAKLIIATNNIKIKENHLKLAEKNKVNILKTEYDTFITSNIISVSNYISNLAKTSNIIVVNENDSVSEFMDIANKNKYSNYPVVDNNNKCLGVLRISEANEKNPKKVILVDHNEKEQSIVGLDEADILEIIDHHKIGNIGTSMPINFRNMPLGSTNSIIYTLFKENNIEIPKDIAGLMMSGIISDTLLFMSPTTTDLDKKIVKDLAHISDTNYEKFAFEMFKAGSSFSGKSKNEILYSDFKNFNINDLKIGIGQISTMTTENLLKEKNEFITVMNNIAKNEDYTAIALFITDIMKNGSYILYNDKAENIFKDAFGLSELKEGCFFEGIVSRKKQIVPKIISIIEKIS